MRRMCGSMCVLLVFALLCGVATADTRKWRVDDFETCSLPTPENGFIDCLQISPIPSSYTKAEDLPMNFDWRMKDGVNYVTPTLNQHIPTYCGACWAFAPLSMMSDRIKIARKAAWPEIVLSPQVLLNCAKQLAKPMGCHGGFFTKTMDYLHKIGLPDQTCAPYEAVEHACTPMAKCKNCFHNGTCVAVSKPTTYKTAEWGEVHGENSMMAEIFHRGPIACQTAVSQEFLDYSGGIFEDKTGEMRIRHVVEIVGWGAEPAEHGHEPIKYWIGRNSWGNYWGENGFFRIARGNNNLNIEHECVWGVPVIPDGMNKGVDGSSA